jgi:hypothetical protein
VAEVRSRNIKSFFMVFPLGSTDREPLEKQPAGLLEAAEKVVVGAEKRTSGSKALIKGVLLRHD